MTQIFKIEDLSHFTGSGQIFKHWWHRQFVCTEGIQYLAKVAHCYWLVDELALVILPELLKQNPDNFYSIEFVAHADQTANISVGDGNGHIYLEKKINWTDFPVKEKSIQLYLCDSSDYYCLMLASEY